MRNFTDGQILTAEDINKHLLNQDTEARQEGIKYLDELKGYQTSLATAKKLAHQSLNPYANLLRFDFKKSTKEKIITETGRSEYDFREKEGYYRCETDLQVIKFGIIANAGFNKLRYTYLEPLTYDENCDNWSYHDSGSYFKCLVGKVKGKIILWIWLTYGDSSNLPIKGRDGDPGIPFYCIGEKA